MTELKLHKTDDNDHVVGPTYAELHQSVDEYAPVRSAERLRSKPKSTTEETARDERSWKESKHAHLNRIMASKAVTQDDLQLYNG